MKDYHDWPSIGSVTPTLCSLFGIPNPAICAESPLDEVLRISRKELTDERIEKCLVFAPDAMGSQLALESGSLFAGVLKVAPIRVSLKSVVPPKTPVCFASMFTGAMPERHGIRRAERPVLRCDTLFDALLRAGKRIAIVAVKNCSIDLVFRDRKIDYFSEIYDREVLERVRSLLESDDHDFILAYNQEYDDVMHATGPFSDEAVRAAKNHISGFVRLGAAFDSGWSRYPRAILFSPDHGAHLNVPEGRGTHGEDIPEDMEVNHYYGIRRRKEGKGMKGFGQD